VRSGQDLVRVASLSTERSVTTLLDRNGQQLAEIDDDTVHASADTADAVTPSTWREVEVELGGGRTQLLDSLCKQLRGAGARPSASPSKLAKALPPSDRISAVRRPGKRMARASDVVMAYVEQ